MADSLDPSTSMDLDLSIIFSPPQSDRRSDGGSVPGVDYDGGVCAE